MSAWEAAFQATNAAENACRAASVVLIGRERRRALVRAATHAANRTRIQTLLADPRELPALPPAYGRAGDLTTPEDGRTLVSNTENALVPVFADAAAASSGTERSWAVDQAIDCAVTGIRWGGRSMAFPQSLPDGDVPTQSQDQ